MCRQLGVTRAGYYAWRARKPSQRHLDDDSITTRIRSVYATSLNTYGSPRVTEAMQQAGVPIGNSPTSTVIASRSTTLQHLT